MTTFRQSRFFSVYGFSFVATCALITLVGLLMGSDGLIAMLTLTALEITFSLDNAVVNAQVLERMSAFWRRIFMTVGILIAVFGMRLLLPIVLVAITASLGFADVIHLALNDPAEYARKLQLAHPVISAFGGMFLLMVFVDYLFGESKSRFTAAIKAKLRVKGAERYIGIFVAMLVLAFIGISATPNEQAGILLAGMLGIVVFVGVRAVSDAFTTAHAKHKHTTKAFVRGGFITFLYLELLDASFSFDSVIGAFAITSNVLLIAAGLGAGAVWVRSITIDLVKNGTLQHYPYLNLGAHLAIGSLATFLLVGIHLDLPDLLTGGTGLAIIIISFLASVIRNRREAAEPGVLARIASRIRRR